MHPLPTDASDRACADELAKLRWPNGFHCSRCHSAKYYRLKARPRVFECALCGKQQSVTAGTLLHRTRIPLSHWFAAASLLMHPAGSAATAVARALGHQYRTAWRLLHRLRAALADADPGLLRGMTDAATILLPVKRPRSNHMVGITVLCDEKSRVLATPTRQAGYRIRRHFRRLRNKRLQAKELPPTLALGATLRMARELALVHFGVSELWLHRYLDAMCWRENHVEPFDSARPVLSRALREVRASFPELRPKGCSAFYS